MATPVFEEFDPAGDCDCPGCAHWRRVLPYSRAGRHPAARRAVIVAAAASAALGAGHVAPALAAPYAPPGPGVPAGDEPSTPQGTKAPLHGRGGQPVKPKGALRVPATTRAEIINRARKWVDARVPYSMSEYWTDGYRQDCSGFVSMAWGLTGNEWTGSLGQYGTQIAKEELEPGDILLFHNPADPQKGSHVVIFGGWTDYTHTYYIAYEQTPPHARRQATPYAYWNNSDRYVPYRYKGLAADAAEAQPTAPGVRTRVCRPIRSPRRRIRERRISAPARTTSTSPSSGRCSSRAAPGPSTRRAPARAGPTRTAGPPRPSSRPRAGRTGTRTGCRGRTPGSCWSPGKASPSRRRGRRARPRPMGWTAIRGGLLFRPGANNEFVTRLGERLVKKGFGKYYTAGPGPRWGEADRRNVEAFQRSQGWRGGAADGCPGPETWRRLFS